MAVLIPGEVGHFAVIIGVIFALCYILFADGLRNGQSIGKRVVETAVVDARNGKPCSFGQSFVRNLLSILGVIDWMLIFGRRRQRLGDRAAHTVVIYEAREYVAGE